MEVVAFGTFLSFYKFSSERFRSKTLRDEFYLLQSVKSIRNACAHNNCILNNMTNGTSMFNAQPAVTQALGDIGVSLSQRRSKMIARRMTKHMRSKNPQIPGIGSPAKDSHLLSSEDLLS